MKVFRIAKKKYIKDLSGEGARLYGGRWNEPGFSMVYFSESLSLCVLEILVHLDYKFLKDDFYFIEVDIPNPLIKSSIKTNDLPNNWRDIPSSQETKLVGTQWLSANKSVAMRVPSAILPSENNILLNPNHKLIGKVKVININKLEIDGRLIGG